MLLLIIIDFLSRLINASINNKNIYLAILSNLSLYSYSNLSRRSLILVIDIISLINLSSPFNVISFSLSIILIRVISSISLAYESLSYIEIIKIIKTIKVIKLRPIKIIKKTLISHY